MTLITTRLYPRTSWVFCVIPGHVTLCHRVMSRCQWHYAFPLANIQGHMSLSQGLWHHNSKSDNSRPLRGRPYAGYRSWANTTHIKIGKIFAHYAHFPGLSKFWEYQESNLKRAATTAFHVPLMDTPLCDVKKLKIYKSHFYHYSHYLTTKNFAVKLM